MKRFFVYLLTALILFSLDFLSKQWVHQHIPLMHMSFGYPYGGIGVFNDYGVSFSIVHTINHGALWGHFAQYAHLLVGIRISIACGLLIYLFKSSSALKFPLVLILTGAIGNITDFFVYGHVVDFLHFKFFNYHYPVFNIADSLIVCGVGLLVISQWLKKPKSSSAYANHKTFS